MTLNNSPDQYLKDHTLERISRERFRLTKKCLANGGINMTLPEEEVVSYLTEKDRQLLDDVYLLGPAEKILPDAVGDNSSKDNLLYFFSSNDAEVRRRKNGLEQLGVAEQNGIGAMRETLMFWALKDACPPGQIDALASELMAPKLKERAIFLAGEYNLQLPPKWTRETPRKQITQLLMSGIRDLKEPVRGAEGIIASDQKGGVSAGGNAMETALNDLYLRNLTEAFAELFERRPDPAAFSCELLNTPAFRELLRFQVPSIQA